jgi:hypothetical protein
MLISALAHMKQRVVYKFLNANTSLLLLLDFQEGNEQYLVYEHSCFRERKLLVRHAQGKAYRP